MHQAARTGVRQDVRDALRTRGDAVHGDPPRVPTEGGNVVADPAQGVQLVGKSGGTGTRERLTEQITQVQEPEGTKAIGHADHHQSVPRQRYPVGVERRRSGGIAAAVDPHQHGQTLGRQRPVRAGDRQVQAVLVRGRWRRSTERRRHCGRRRALPGDRRDFDRFPDSRPGLERSRRSVPEVTDRRRRERDTAPDEQAVGFDAPHQAGAGADLGVRILHWCSLGSAGANRDAAMLLRSGCFACCGGVCRRQQRGGPAPGCRPRHRVSATRPGSSGSNKVAARQMTSAATRSAESATPSALISTIRLASSTPSPANGKIVSGYRLSTAASTDR